jgi:hypothetical protein
LVNGYDANFEFISLRIEDAFNEGWWKGVGGYNPLRHPELTVFNEGPSRSNVLAHYWLISLCRFVFEIHRPTFYDTIGGT